ncbi:MAG: hypothetical protein DDG60_04945 [Anaerolineae bacterium]|nr:MAG: hypothetical protein DDG60_04945 [Anaerolineae bacterium]
MMNTIPVNKKFPLKWLVLGILSLVLFVGTFVLVRNLVTSWCLSPLPGVALTGCGGNDSAPMFTETNNNTPEPGLPTPELPPPAPVIPNAELPPAWDGASRINVLLLGLDSYDGSADRSGPARSDTMILLTLDPKSNTAGILSIPRDLWVNIPGFGYGRINTAYMLGDANKLPGGGPALAMKTVEQVIGVPVQYYAQIEFAAFVRLIDELDKIPVFVEKNIVIDPIGPGADEIFLSRGPHMLGGVEALAYARNRYTEGGDVDRAKRQQQVIMGIRQRVLEPANFPRLVASAPQIYSIIQDGINTNLTFDQIMRLGMLASGVPEENIKRGIINYEMMIPYNVTVNGQNQAVYKPIPDKIRELRDEIFTAQGAISPLAQGADALDLARQEGAKIAVYNGTYTSGLAQKTADYLRSLGFDVVIVDSASNFPGTTIVVDRRGRPYALRYFKELFRLNAAIQIQSNYTPEAPADIEIILGPDWAASNPMP